MKFATLLPLLFLFAVNFHSQDLIVTHEGDSLNCAITYIGAKKIHFTRKKNNAFKSSTIRKKKIIGYQLAYFRDSITREIAIVNIPETQHYRVALSAGYGHAAPMYFSDVIAYNRYDQKLRNGIQFNGEFTYFVNDVSGWGLIFSKFNPGSATNFHYIRHPSGVYQGVESQDDMSITFIAPSYTSRSVSYDNKRSFFLSISMGYLCFRDKYEFFEKSIMTGGSLGLCSKVGYDRQLTEHLKIGLELSYLFGAAANLRLANGGTVSTYESSALHPNSLRRFDASIGLRYYW